jgi:hypothetical protein
MGLDPAADPPCGRAAALYRQRALVGGGAARIGVVVALAGAG